MPIRETELYIPVRTFLQSLGFTVYSEVADCDVSAVHGSRLLAVELKTSINLKLITQAVERQESYDEVYIAAAVHGSSQPPDFPAKLRVVKRLGLGLLLVRFLSHRTRVEVVCEAAAGTQYGRNSASARSAILAELAGRSGDFTLGGSRGKRITAYREEALFLAILLSKHARLSPAECRRRNGSPKSGSILRDNHYGWFERVQRGIYRLSPAGREALHEYRTVIEAWDLAPSLEPDEPTG